jgi:hypothetical protein
MMTSSSKTIVLGAEHDVQLLATVVEVLRDMAATMLNHTWGVAGSQEIRVLEATVNGHPVRIEVETYVGITLTSNGELADEIARRVQAHRS